MKEFVASLYPTALQLENVPWSEFTATDDELAEPECAYPTGANRTLMDTKIAQASFRSCYTDSEFCLASNIKFAFGGVLGVVGAECLVGISRVLVAVVDKMRSCPIHKYFARKWPEILERSILSVSPGHSMHVRTSDGTIIVYCGVNSDNDDMYSTSLEKSFLRVK